jgi:hypothetical protein
MSGPHLFDHGPDAWCILCPPEARLMRELDRVTRERDEALAKLAKVRRLRERLEATGNCASAAQIRTAMAEL